MLVTLSRPMIVSTLVCVLVLQDMNNSSPTFTTRLDHLLQLVRLPPFATVTSILSYCFRYNSPGSIAHEPNASIYDLSKVV